MTFLKKIIDKLWIVIIIASLIVFVALATPAGFCIDGDEWNACWIFGLKVDTSGALLLDYANEYQLANSLFNSFFIVISSIVLLNTGLLLRKKEVAVEKLWFLWVICGIVLITSIILFNISTGNFETDYWTTHTIGFGVIGPFISGAISFVSGILVRFSKINELKVEI